MPTARRSRRRRPWPIRVWRSASAVWRGPRTQGVLPWLVSFSLHAGLVVVAGLIAWRVQEERPGAPPIVARFDEPAIAAAMAEPPVPMEEPDAAELVEELLTPGEQIPAEAPALPAPPELPALTPPADAVTEPPRLVSPDASARVEFSGLGVSEARDIVYVVDASGSMVTSMASVVAELGRSISALHPVQRFQVLLFREPVGAGADEPGFVFAPLPAPTASPVLFDATRANKAAALEWLSTITPRFRSNPLPALEAALTLRPDAVFLLSSGATEPALMGATAEEVLARLDRLNPRRRDGSRAVVIRAIQVLEEDPVGLLRQIAEAHGGENGYKFISRGDLASRAPGASP